MVFLFAIASPTISRGRSYHALPPRFLRPVSSGDGHHAPQKHPDLGKSSQGSWDRRIQGKSGRMAQRCSPDCVSSLSAAITCVGSADYACTIASERNHMTLWDRLGRIPGGKPFGRSMNICRERFLSCSCLHQCACPFILNPSRYSTLSITKVNTWGLVYVWKGRDDSLKPLLLAAHQGLCPIFHRDLDPDSRSACKTSSR